MKSEILKVDHISKSFGKNKIVDSISFSANEGDIFGFIGPNGAGKTTTIKMLLGLLTPDKGKVYISGKDIRTNFKDIIAQVGALVEGPSFYSYMTAKENLEIFGQYSGGVTKERIKEVLDLVGLFEKENIRVREFSLGMKQRLGIAQALINNPRLLILDEPINGLDPKWIKEIRNIIFELSKQGTTILISSHILAELEHLCNKILIINKGKEVASGITQELIGKSNMYKIEATNYDRLDEVLEKISAVEILENAFERKIRFNSTIKPEELLIKLINEGIKVTSYAPVKLTLEDYFFNIVEE
ncbi:ABC transporter ATP-binding protein [Cellulosilyticum ruminicola]|uniref:ABC transporter ATP-binding protein n=1 Tax=Cellulosilyticum ruminicola TaxID=425254 RepID=UPI0006D0967E|nr:ABC transporter ATP-binding protein [Cellulosilyticum ruminicola]